jgi:hypothetical protein
MSVADRPEALRPARGGAHAGQDARSGPSVPASRASSVSLIVLARSVTHGQVAELCSKYPNVRILAMRYG